MKSLGRKRTKNSWLPIWLSPLSTINIQYRTKKSEQRFFCFEPPIHILGNCLALDPNSGGKWQWEWWELGRKKKRSSVLNWSLSMSPLPRKKNNMNKIRQDVWNFHGGRRMNNRPKLIAEFLRSEFIRFLWIFPALYAILGSFWFFSSLVRNLTMSLRLF